jgi:serine/threonine protein kinase
MESHQRVLAETEAKLYSTMKNLHGLEASHASLREKHDSLSDKFNKLCDSAVDMGWNYCPEKSSDFSHIPCVNPEMLETDSAVGHYALQRLLGQGQFSMVYSAFKNNESSVANTQRFPTEAEALPLGAAVAIKSIEKRSVPGIQDIIRLENEVHALMRLRDINPDLQSDANPVGRSNVVRFYEVLHGPRYLHIVTECMPLDMYGFMQQFRARINSDVGAVLVRDVSAGLYHLQQHGICHRDIKPENLLVSVSRHDISVKICDMRLCAFVQPVHQPSIMTADGEGDGEDDAPVASLKVRDLHASRNLGNTQTRSPLPNSTLLSGFEGSPGFFAPEILLHSSYCGFCADVFSLGCVALEILTKPSFFSRTWLPPYEALHTENAPEFPRMIRAAAASAVGEVGRVHCGISNTARYNESSICGLLACLLDFRPNFRPTPSALLQHTWIANADRFRAVAALHDRVAGQTLRVPGASKILFSPIGSPAASPQSSAFPSAVTSANSSPQNSRASSPLCSPLSSPFASPRANLHSPDWNTLKNEDERVVRAQRSRLSDVLRGRHALGETPGSQSGKYGGNVTNRNIVAPIVPRAPAPGGADLSMPLMISNFAPPALVPSTPPHHRNVCATIRQSGEPESALKLSSNMPNDVEEKYARKAGKSDDKQISRRQSTQSNGAYYAAAPLIFSQPGTVDINEMSMGQVAQLMIQRMQEKETAFPHSDRAGKESIRLLTRVGKPNKERVLPSQLLKANLSDEENTDDELVIHSPVRPTKLGQLKNLKHSSSEPPSETKNASGINESIPFGARIHSILRRQSLYKSQRESHQALELREQEREAETQTYPKDSLARSIASERESGQDLDALDTAMSALLEPRNQRCTDLESAIDGNILAINTAMNEVQRCFTPPSRGEVKADNTDIRRSQLTPDYTAPNKAAGMVSSLAGDCISPEPGSSILPSAGGSSLNGSGSHTLVRFVLGEDALRVNSRRSSNANIPLVLVPRSKKQSWSRADLQGSKSLSGRVVVDRFREGIGKRKGLQSVRKLRAPDPMQASELIDPGQRQEQQMNGGSHIPNAHPRPASSTHDLHNPYLTTIPHNEIHTHSAGMMGRGARKVAI